VNQIVEQSGLVDGGSERRILSEIAAPEIIGRGNAEEDVLRDGGLIVEAFRIERFDEIGHALRLECLAQPPARFDDVARKFRIPLRIDAAGKSEQVDLGAHADLFHQVDEGVVVGDQAAAAAAAANEPKPKEQPGSGRYAASRPAAIFANARNADAGGSLFGDDLISEKSLDEVILSYLSDDLDSSSSKK